MAKARRQAYSLDSSYPDSCESSRSCSPSVDMFSNDEGISDTDCADEQAAFNSTFPVMLCLAEFDYLRGYRQLMASLDRAAASAQNQPVNGGSDITERASQLRATLDGLGALSAVVGETFRALTTSINKVTSVLTRNYEELKSQRDSSVQRPAREQCSKAGHQVPNLQGALTSHPVANTLEFSAGVKMCEGPSTEMCGGEGSPTPVWPDLSRTSATPEFEICSGGVSSHKSTQAGVDQPKECGSVSDPPGAVAAPSTKFHSSERCSELSENGVDLSSTTGRVVKTEPSQDQHTVAPQPMVEPHIGAIPVIKAEPLVNEHPVDGAYFKEALHTKQQLVQPHSRGGPGIQAETDRFLTKYPASTVHSGKSTHQGLPQGTARPVVKSEPLTAECHGPRMTCMQHQLTEPCSTARPVVKTNLMKDGAMANGGSSAALFVQQQVAQLHTIARVVVKTEPLGNVQATAAARSVETLVMQHPLDQPHSTTRAVVKTEPLVNDDIEAEACFIESSNLQHQLAQLDSTTRAVVKTEPLMGDDAAIEARSKEARRMLLQLAQAHGITGSAVKPEPLVYNDLTAGAHPREALSILHRLERNQAGPSSGIGNESLVDEQNLEPPTRGRAMPSPSPNIHDQDPRAGAAQQRPDSPYRAFQRPLAARPGFAFPLIREEREEDAYSDSLDSSYHSPPRPASEVSDSSTESTLDSNEISLVDSGYSSADSSITESSTGSEDQLYAANNRRDLASPEAAPAARPALPARNREEDESDSVSIASELLSDADFRSADPPRRAAQKRRRDSDDTDSSVSDTPSRPPSAKKNRQ